MGQLTRSMGGVVQGMDGVLKSMDPDRITAVVSLLFISFNRITEYFTLF
tara:strand:- start:296 stop:442 length:147 start_codon:yes stop_codon:yes gene_type:complete